MCTQTSASADSNTPRAFAQLATALYFEYAMFALGADVLKLPIGKTGDYWNARLSLCDLMIKTMPDPATMQPTTLAASEDMVAWMTKYAEERLR